jgi:hypothetical protein
MAAIMEGTRYAAGNYRHADAFVNEGNIIAESQPLKPVAPMAPKPDLMKYAVIGLLILGAMIAINKFGVK